MIQKVFFVLEFLRFVFVLRLPTTIPMEGDAVCSSIVGMGK